MVKGLAGLPLDIRILSFEFIIGLVDAAASGSCKEYDSLALETIGFNESVDDGGSCVPSDRETDVDGVITVCILEIFYDGRAGIAVLHFHTTP